MILVVLKFILERICLFSPPLPIVATMVAQGLGIRVVCIRVTQLQKRRHTAYMYGIIWFYIILKYFQKWRGEGFEDDLNKLCFKLSFLFQTMFHWSAWNIVRGLDEQITFCRVLVCVKESLWIAVKIHGIIDVENVDCFLQYGKGLVIKLLVKLLG